MLGVCGASTSDIDRDSGYSWLTVLSTVAPHMVEAISLELWCSQSLLRNFRIFAVNPSVSENDS